MIGRMALPEEDVGRCLLCHEAPCTAACAHGLDPAGLLRSLRFHRQIRHRKNPWKGMTQHENGTYEMRNGGI